MIPVNHVPFKQGNSVSNYMKKKLRAFEDPGDDGTIPHKSLENMHPNNKYLGGRNGPCDYRAGKDTHFMED